VGGRLDFQSAFGQRLSPRAALVLTPAEGTTLRLTYNEAFRAPSLYETTEFDPTYRITPQHLRPETVRSAEAELRQQVSRLTVSLRGYYASYSDMIESRNATLDEVTPFLSRLSSTVDPEQVRVNDNLIGLKVLGGSVAPQVRLPWGFTLAGSLNFSRAEDEAGVLNRNLPRWFGNFRAGWQASGDGLSIMWVGLFSGQRRVLFNETPTDFTIGGRLDQRLTASGALGDGALKGLRWRATVGFDLNAQQPYAIATGTDTPSGLSLYPDQPRVYAFVGLQYRGEGSAR
jgi:outer membrane receptor protein involved in Fe transport